MTNMPAARGTSSLSLPAELQGQLKAWACEGYPREVCGLLLGTQRNGSLRITQLTRGANLNTERAHDRYELDPRDFLAADAAARAQGLEVLGVWHTHPDHPAVPSATDREAAWDGWSYVIVAASGDGRAEIRSWRLDSERGFREEVICE